MRDIRTWKNGKKFEVKIHDTFTGESIIIDNDFISKKPLTIRGYMGIDVVKEMIESKKPLTSFSLQ